MELVGSFWRIEPVSEEPDFAARTDDYAVRMRVVRDFARPDIEGHMGSVYFILSAEQPSLKGNTGVYSEREEGLAAGRALMDKYQRELDETVGRVKLRLT